MGTRFAVAGGREGWIRTLLTALGVGLGVTLLLTAASVPEFNSHQQQRSEAREPAGHSAGLPKGRSDSTLITGGISTTYRDHALGGRVLRAEGAHPILPPGLDKLPGDKEMAVSPALRSLLNSGEGKLLKERFSDYRVTGTIAEAGLKNPQELYFYVGSSSLTRAQGGSRVAAFGNQPHRAPLAPLLLMLTALVCVVLLTPVVIFITTAVRFGGERRDARLAALRLVGADTATVRRIAAGETLFGAVLGLLAGAVMFLVGREFAGGITLMNMSAYPDDLTPVPALVALIVVAVPVTAVVVTLFSLRAVAIEPLGVVRDTAPRERRLWWRLITPVAGIAILLLYGRMDSDTGVVNTFAIAAGAALTLVGLTTLLPWLVEVAVARLRGGPVPWQLATRRLQLSSGTAARAVSGITVAVAGAVALQMTFTAMNADFRRTTGQDPHRAQMVASSANVSGGLAERMIDEFRTTEGVKGVIGYVETYVTRPGRVPADSIQPTSMLTVGSCATLRELARIGSCTDGDTFVVHTKGKKRANEWVDETARPGKPVNLSSGGKPVLWTLPKDARTVLARRDPGGDRHDGVFATTGAVPTKKMVEARSTAMVQTDRKTPQAEDHILNTAYRLDPMMRVVTYHRVERDAQYASIHRGLQIGAILTMALIAASLLVSMIEQLRERKRLLSALTAFGTRRTSMSWSVLWQTAIPVVLGLALATVGGLALGATLVHLIEKKVTDWMVFLPLVGAGGVLILVVTLCSLPPLWRMMRADRLRTE
ncbi:ABC transporter permease [Streptomyces tsukubensis]|uniref:ABC transporter permease n=1 Tax=Streptomyces tsukubensis TaxID=83656 RepID=UPI000D1C81B1|nr:FtsX-like permease family protein [Streptomyces tsukubensis]QFR95510.1 FtsX-like permease family protein [Streptomyces tsukubensis]